MYCTILFMGKIAYGRRRTEKETGYKEQRMHVVEQSEFSFMKGQHRSYHFQREVWYLAQGEAQR